MANALRSWARMPPLGASAAAIAAFNAIANATTTAAAAAAGGVASGVAAGLGTGAMNGVQVFVWPAGEVRQLAALLARRGDAWPEPLRKGLPPKGFQLGYLRRSVKRGDGWGETDM